MADAWERDPHPWEADPYDDIFDGWSSDYTPEIAEDYCDYCEREGHTFRTCPRRDDDDTEF